MNTGEKIKMWRKERGLTQKRLAELTDIAEITIRNYEAGKYKPKIDKLRRIASALRCDIYLLLDDDEGIYSEDEKRLAKQIDQEDRMTRVNMSLAAQYFLPLNDKNKAKAIEYMDLLKFRQDAD